MRRRDFLHIMMAGTTAVGTAHLLRPLAAWGQSLPAATAAGAAPPRPLAIVTRTLDINGKAARVFGLVQPDGSHGLTLDAAGLFDVELANTTDAATLIHWHGLTPPWPQDGVPDVPAAMITPADRRRYTFPAGAGGTHWMHAHTLQEQELLAAPLIVRTAADRQRDEQEVVILLHDFSFTPPAELLEGLRKGSGPHAMPMDHSAMSRGGMSMGSGAMAGHSMGAMAMDVNDIDYDAYLANDRTLDDPEVVKVERGGRVRLRIINGATATAFTIDTGAIDGELIAVDGKPVQPIRGRAFPMAMGQRVDIRLTLPPGAHPILALREGAAERAGIILATPGAAISKVPVKGDDDGPLVGLALEERLRPLEPLSARRPDRRVDLTLTGSMAGYVWGIEGSAGLRARRGERLEVTMRNRSMMMHPMHLHGHHFQVVAINGKAIAGAVRDTVAVPPMASVTVAFDADNPGRWPLHCHHLYHMATGMMAFVVYDGIS